MKSKFIIILLLLITATGINAQTDYYWYNGNKIFLEKSNTKKYLIINDSISSKEELSKSIKDSSITIESFMSTNLLNLINPLDFNLTEKCYAIVSCNDSINELQLLRNPDIVYVGSYFTVNNMDIGLSNLFHLKLKSASDTIMLDSLANKYHLNILGNVKVMPLWYTFECTDLTQGNSLTILNAIHDSKLFESTQPGFVYRIELSCTNDLHFNDQWGLQNNSSVDIDIDACSAWTITKGSSDVIISVIDTGVKLDHEDIEIDSQISWDIETGQTPSSIYWNEPDDELGNYNHGTNCAGIISASHNNLGVAGVTPDCEIMSISYNFYNESNPDLRLASGIDYAWQNGADVISISWSSPESPLIDDAINNAITYGRNGKGTVIVASSGNFNNDTVDYPSVIPDVISVGAINKCGTRVVGWHTVDSIEHALMAECVGETWPMGQGSHYGHGLSVVAPGHNVYTTNAKDENFWTDLYIAGFGGTSAAAPHVSGVAALLLSINPDLTYVEVKDWIEYSAQKIRTDFYSYNVSKPNGMWNEKLGYGLVNAYFALLLLADDMCNVIPFISYPNYTIWDDQKYICQDLEIHGTLVIDGAVNFLYNDPQIIVSGSGRLIIEDDCVLNTWQSDRPFDGTITVEPGGRLEVRNGASLKISGEGNIQVLSGTTNNGEFIFKQGATIELLDDNSVLNIAGDLTIDDNAVFSFIGDGFIKFSNPGGDATYNISSGAGSSVFLQGNDRDDKILEIQQSSVRFPAELVNLEFRDGKIEMGSNKRILKEVISGTLSHSLTLNNIKITSDNGSYNGHRGFTLWGQPNVTISNCEFEFGKYGLNNHVYWGQSISVSNSAFNFNETGLYTYAEGISLFDCNFSNNTNYGFHADNMCSSSSISYCVFADNGNGAYYKGSASALLDVEKTVFDDNQINGLKLNGGFDANIICSHIYDNTNGVYNQGAKLYLNSGDINTFSGNSKSIYMNTGYLYLYNANNQLIPASGGYSVYGYISSRTDCYTPEYLNCNGNRWFTSPAGQSPSFGNNYRTYIYGCNPRVKMYLTDNNPYAYSTICGIENPPGGGVLLSFIGLSPPLLVGSNSNGLSLSEQFETLSQTPIENISLTACVNLFDDYIDLIESTTGSSLTQVRDIQIKAWGEIHNVLDVYYKKIDKDCSNQMFNFMLEQLISLNELLIADVECTQEEIVEYKLDNALLNRMRKEFDLSLTQLEALQIETDAMPLQNLEVNSWLCHISAEKLAYYEIISPDEFQLSILECNTFYENEFGQRINDMFAEEDIAEEIEIQYLDIIPNPNTGNLVVNVENAIAGSQLQIVNSYSQPIAQENIDVDGNTSFQFNGYAAGFYTVYYLENGAVVDSEGIVVE